MIIACPACATRYAVPDSAIGIDGRTVRCAKCRHSWFQDGPVLEMAEGIAPAHATPVVDAAEAAPRPQVAEPVPPPPAPEPAVAREAPTPRPVYDDTAGTQFTDEGPSRFDFAPPFRPRRNWAKIGMAAAVVFAVVTLGLAGVVAWAGLPDWVPVARPTFAQAQQDLALDFPPKRQDRRTLPNGTEYFGASGTVSNIGRETRSVPTILIVLRDARERIVYSWEVVPPKRELAPGETITINEAVTDVPKSAKSAEIGWKPA
ncbi:zinc-ribbon domain-containing protein [Novosphingobium sp. 9U]|uniref:zinc-ribbon domain-containing protein n=1 Tax=Novosphingobium sp. 9U TaxID=2653158 RepID=UPI00135911AE|nr:zinc-ribbon domain-containing protein [Novosphingobium sp. 9U]